MRLLHLTEEDLTAVRTASLVVLDHPAAFWIHGPGADTCLQGLLTNDVIKPGDGRMIYGALLTAKGAIVVDYWVIRSAGGFLLLADAAGREPSLDLFRRQLPPRLARTTDLTGRVAVLWLLGPSDAAQRAAVDLLTAQGWSGPPLPADAGAAVCLTSGDDTLRIARAPAAAPFSAVVAGPATVVEALGGSLVSRGHRPGSFAQLRVARVLAGFPSLGAEIGERTLPQEVRYDEIGGVSYDKGCYVGQETVARIHFRGHPNWVLRGVELVAADTAGGDPDEALTADGKTVGRLTSLVAPDGTPRFGLASVRREVEGGAELTSGFGTVRVVELPFPAPA